MLQRSCGEPGQSPLDLQRKLDGHFPDYTTTVAKARAAFTDVRKALHGQRGIPYSLLRILYKDEDMEFADPMKAEEYVQKISYPTYRASGLNVSLTCMDDNNKVCE